MNSNRKRAFDRRLTAGVTLLCLVAAGSARAQTQDFVGPVKELEPRSTETLVAKAKWGDVTLQDLLAYYRDYLHATQTVPFLPVVEPEIVTRMPAVWLDKLARSYVIARGSEVSVDTQADPQMQEECERQYNSYLLNYALPEVKKRLVAPLVTDPTDEEIAAHYERTKPLHFVPFQFSMRHIFLSTYETHVLKKNETLEGIAQRVSGDRAKVADILADVEGKPERWVPPEQRRARFFKPEVEGERLLVPMSEDKVAAVRKRMEDIRARALAGEDFAKLAREVSNAPIKGEVIGPLPSGVAPARWMQKELIQAAHKTPAGQMTEIIRGRNGFHLMLIVDKKEERVKPLEEVRDAVRGQIRKNREAEVEARAMMSLFEMPELKLEMDLLDKAPDIAEDAVVARVGPHGFLWRDMKPLWEKHFEPGSGRAGIIEVLRYHGGIGYALTLEWAKKNGVFESPDLAPQVRHLRTGVYGATLNKRELEDYLKEAVSPETVRQYYESRKDSDFREPLTGTYIQLVRPAPAGAGPEELEKLRASLEAELARFRTIHDFRNLAKKSNPPPPPGKPWEVVGFTDLETMAGRLGEKLRALKSGEWSGAFIEDGAARAVALMERKEPRSKALVEVEKSIVETLRNRSEGEARGLLESHWLADTGYQFVLEDPPGVPNPPLPSK